MVQQYRTPMYSGNKKMSNKKGRLDSQGNKKIGSHYYSEVSVERALSRIRNPSLDQLSCFLLGVLSCVTLIRNIRMG